MLHFISGLPRSGSTLLSAVLRQNPRFYAGVTSPVAMLCGNLLNGISSSTEFASFFTDKRRRDLVKSLIGSYYADTSNPVIFDTNRAWTSWLPLLCVLYPDARIICCVRQVGWIIDSVERLTRANPAYPSKLFNFRTGGSVYSRVEVLMNPEKGLIGSHWSSLREAWFSELASRLMVIDYDSLAERPAEIIARLYAELGEEPFEHDFNDVSYDSLEYDADLGLPGLHKVRKEVSMDRRPPCIPPDLFAKYADVNFWLNPNLNPRRVCIL